LFHTCRDQAEEELKLKLMLRRGEAYAENLRTNKR
jgi:hypothetical protein